MTKMIDMDMVAEMHYADRDPAYQTEEDLNQQKEDFEEKTVHHIEQTIIDMFKYMSNSEMEVIKKNADYLADYLYDVIEEWE